jgi:hypothetical protein
MELLIPYSHGELVSLAHTHGFVDHEEHTPDGTHIHGRIPLEIASRYTPYWITSQDSDKEALARLAGAKRWRREDDETAASDAEALADDGYADPALDPELDDDWEDGDDDGDDDWDDGEDDAEDDDLADLTTRA